jgi:hypothetical protein
VGLTSLIAGGYHHLTDQRTDILAGLPIGATLNQRFRETKHLGAVVLSDIRMYVRQIDGSL